MDLDPSGETFNATSFGYGDIYVTKLDGLGNFVWAKTAGGTGDDQGWAVTIDASYSVYVAGRFSSSIIPFAENILTNIDSSGYNYELFVAKLDHSSVGIETPLTDDNISIYPNPTSDHVTITLPTNSKKVSVTITDLSGKIIYSATEAATQKIEVSTKDFAEGVYVVRVQAAEYSLAEKVVVVK
jgi:hypothetical protein